MKKLYYPAIFHVAEEGGFWVSFPDIPECFTEGDNMDEAYERAEEALGLALTERLREGENLPMASDFRCVGDEGTLVVIPLDLDEYNRKYRNRAVKKTLTIPEWLNEKALDMNINFSQVLQEALLERII
ncbi:MAG: type II toxin-antitoxin system HicB family antitoxin [Clostridiales bacterium]|nr:type II toxin-antitoxin system HicB family antitoxin [Clostridiales bacterium]